MKIRLWHIAALTSAITLMVGCSEDNFSEQSAITFSVYQQTHQTRGVSNKKVKDFYVDAYLGNSKEPNFMHNQLVSYKEGKGYTYSPIKYWPKNTNEPPKFFGYWLGKDKYLNDEGKTELSVDGKTDMLYSNITIPKQNNHVKLEFHHLLASIIVKVEAKEDLPNDVNIKLTNVKLKNIYTKGSINRRKIDNPQIDVDKNYSSHISIPNGEDISVLPQHTFGLKIEVEYDFQQKNNIGEWVHYRNQKLSANIPNNKVAKWESGKQYTYTWKISPNHIVFDVVDIKDWGLENIKELGV